jgi:beta-galactosidase
VAETCLSQVRIGQFAWTRIEPEPGQFTWASLDQAIELTLSDFYITTCAR